MIDHSESLLSIESYPDLTFQEKDRLPLSCFKNSYCYSGMHIPRHLLTNRQESWESRGVFHTLEKRGHAKKLEPFTVYSDSDDSEVCESEIFESDSDEDFSFDCISSEIRKTEENTKNTVEKTENFCELKSFPAKSNISLTEILCTPKEVDITNFEFKKPYKPNKKEEETWLPSVKNKNSNKKRKAVNSVSLGKFLEDYTEEDKQEAYANDYLRKILKSKNGDEDKIQLRNDAQFPDLTTKGIEFMNKKSVEENPKNVPAIVETFSQAGKDEEIIFTETETPALETTVGKIAIENIPSEMSQNDILLFLDGYGEIKDFNLEQHGNFFTAFVTIDLSCDIDWIIECLNGTEAFGVSSRVLKCYKLD